MSTLMEKLNTSPLVKHAYDFAEHAHKGQLRKSGDPYFTHCVGVAESVLKWNLDDQSIAAALLHDVVEDTSYTREDIASQFGKEVAFLVEGLTKLEEAESRGSHSEAESLRKMLLAMVEDPRVIIIKLADRYHNLRTLQHLSPERQKTFAKESIDIFAPIAYRLGMNELKGEIEDISFPYAFPEEYAWVMNTFKGLYAERANYLRRVTIHLSQEFSRYHIPITEIQTRAKHHYSLYKKLLKYNMNQDKIYDLVAVRIIVPSVGDCYAVLGMLHKLWKPLPGRIKDYIAMKKPNGYQSLHTTVFCLDNRITEFQIRTQDMHALAENGVAAHWLYKEQTRGSDAVSAAKARLGETERQWIERLRNWQNDFTSSEEFVDSLKHDVLSDQIYVFTPQGDIVELPDGSSPLDFAYKIHTEIGNTYAGAKADGHIVSLTYRLQNGQIVEVMTQKNKKPARDWIKTAHTSLARKKIKHELNVLEQKTRPTTTRLELKLTVENRVGMLRDATELLSAHHCNIEKVTSGATLDKFTTLSFLCTFKEKSVPSALVVKLKKIRGIKEVEYKVKN
ncbi:MAG: bifunctional (p)ppGpp synthetase/guanosine-3',5'-bis(diphosphate) 3'-pyrophosphohydrolase [Patescibacteria group bacterium]|nr:bifunctional (p)ppGpp synthetase/guanosine-3',5'-bis(diphosphate) 3'-pyrophosphohydrolase [Patescibacteria group bacterium]MDE2438418.1 bifunctional (p)ppGpp synthetase/guanosine-3',5'-bis(diphosphate) 3'-pyrophosphohydrolase [Patescibacteria group bacterium]